MRVIQFLFVVLLMASLAGCTFNKCQSAPGAEFSCMGFLWGQACADVHESCDLNSSSSNP